MDSTNPTGAQGDAGTTHATTIRFDADMWAAIQQHARRLGVAQAAFIRDATRAEVVRLAEREGVARELFGAELNGLHVRVERIEQWIGGRR